MRNSTTRRARGFSLIEIIITLVVLAIAGTMLATFMGPGVTRSSDPIFALQNDADLQMVMENMIADQKAHYSTNTAALSTFSTTLVGAVGSDQNNVYGEYHVERNSLCYLPSGSTTFTDDAANGTYLCVTISAPGQSGSKISYLFTAISP